MLAIPEADRYWLADARVPRVLLRDAPGGARADPEGSLRVDLGVEHGRVTRVEPAGMAPFGDLPVANLAGRHVWPALVDLHTHLDKSQVIGRIGPVGATFASAREAIAADRAKHWSRADIRARMEFSIRSAYAHGVGAIRTHIDSYEGQAEPSWEVFAELHQAWTGRIALQATASVPIDVYVTDYGRRLADLAAATPGGLLGGVLRRSTDHDYGYIPEIDALLDAQFRLAKERSLPIDLHVDETLRPDNTHLEHVARAVMRHGMEGRVTCGHCCSLSVLPPERVESILALCAQAGLTIVTLPITNLYLQDRAPRRTPRLRGATLAQEIDAAGVPLAIATDNVRDAFYPYGDYDMVDTLRQSVGILHLDQALATALAAIGPVPARAMGIPFGGTIGAAAPANLIAFDAQSLNEILCRPRSDRVVLNKGRRVAARLPAFPASADA